jgi:glycosyltransferase involved in cell wall biosynthesis
MEALSMGVPVISTDVGGMKELILTEQHGSIWTGDPAEGIELIQRIQVRGKKIRSSNLLDLKFRRSVCSQTVMNRLISLKGSH